MRRVVPLDRPLDNAIRELDEPLQHILSTLGLKRNVSRQ